MRWRVASSLVPVSCGPQTENGTRPAIWSVKRLNSRGSRSVAREPNAILGEESLEDVPRRIPTPTFWWAERVAGGVDDGVLLVCPITGRGERRIDPWSSWISVPIENGAPLVGQRIPGRLPPARPGWRVHMDVVMVVREGGPRLARRALLPDHRRDKRVLAEHLGRWVGPLGVHRPALQQGPRVWAGANLEQSVAQHGQPDRVLERVWVLGPRGNKTTIGRHGIRRTIGLPGTGLYATSHQPWQSKRGEGETRARPAIAESEADASAGTSARVLGPEPGSTPPPEPHPAPAQSCGFCGGSVGDDGRCGMCGQPSSRWRTE